MNVKKIFEECTAIDGANEEGLKLLEKILAISSPMEFTDDFISEEDLDNLITEMERLDVKFPALKTFRSVLNSLPPVKGNSRVFI